MDPVATPDVEPDADVDADVDPEVEWVHDPEAAEEAAAWLRVPAATPEAAVPLGRRGGPPAAFSLVDMTVDV